MASRTASGTRAWWRAAVLGGALAGVGAPAVWGGVLQQGGARRRARRSPRGLAWVAGVLGALAAVRLGRRRRTEAEAPFAWAQLGPAPGREVEASVQTSLVVHAREGGDEVASEDEDSELPEPRRGPSGREHPWEVVPRPGAWSPAGTPPLEG
ncbi:hypothetical protein DRW03_25355 [Corallococcus sp. H22C18031201]|uniref:hypothetical protein n=1 Tax=Citreicoccus inhibens TaxID=2849499 RepID=UPI000E770FCF|nr:hypothetical protein [Citreicoccus inhibens]MBU8898973.1 hypothetical protein [Citreicoccus inhibens]RJS18451.1 hypothetical protein DRW03_25355 [Corallococcus sp. H22C18031201]